MLEGFINQIPLVLVIVFLVIGFVLLVKGADYFVEGASGVAKKLKVPSVIVGLTIVSVGTSLPEIAVSVTASAAGNNALAISNAIGSNVFNLMVVIGVCAVLTPVAVEKVTLKRDFPFSVICAAVLMGFGFIGIFVLQRWAGVVLLVMYVIFLIVLIRSALKERLTMEDEQEKIRAVPICILFIVLGGIAIAIGGDLVVDTASRIATEFGMSQTLVGLTIVSIGTSLPELVTSIVAARKKEVGIALGNAIGSNIFNILVVLGLASTINPIGVTTQNIIDIVILVAFSIVVWLVAKKAGWLKRKMGFVMLALYAAFFIYIFVR